MHTELLLRLGTMKKKKQAVDYWLKHDGNSIEFAFLHAFALVHRACCTQACMLRAEKRCEPINLNSSSLWVAII